MGKVAAERGDDKLEVVLYAAKSNEDEHGSIDSQLEELRAAAERNGWQVIGEFSDEAISGYTKSRGHGLRSAVIMAQDGAASGSTVAVLATVSDRLARGDGVKAKHLVEYALEAKRGGFRFVCLSGENLDDIGYAAISGERNARDSEAKAHHVKRGKRHSALVRGRRNGGRRTFGYRKVPFINERGKPDSYDETVQVEKSCYLLVIEEAERDRSQSDIARIVNAHGFRTVSGARFTQSQISQILRSRVYTGWTNYKDEWAPGKHEAFVSVERWEALQTRLDQKRKRGTGRGGRPSNGSHLMTNGLLRCSCGAALAPRTEGRPGSRYEVYRCLGRHQGSRECEVGTLPREPIDSAVWEYVATYGLDIERSVMEAARRAQCQQVAVQEQVAVAASELAKAQERYERIREDYRDGRISGEIWSEERNELRADIEAARAAVERLDRRREEVALAADIDAASEQVRDQIEKVRAAVAGTLGNVEGLADARSALHSLFKRLIVHRVGVSEPDIIDGDLAYPQHGWFIEPILRDEAIVQPRVIEEGEVVQGEVIRKLVVNAEQLIASSR